MKSYAQHHARLSVKMCVLIALMAHQRWTWCLKIRFFQQIFFLFFLKVFTLLLYRKKRRKEKLMIAIKRLSYCIYLLNQHRRQSKWRLHTIIIHTYIEKKRSETRSPAKQFPYSDEPEMHKSSDANENFNKARIFYAIYEYYMQFIFGRKQRENEVLWITATKIDLHF